MSPLLPPPRMPRCSAPSRSFLLGPDGPAGAPPGKRLRSGALIGLRENREQKQDPHYKVSTVRGEPRPARAEAAVEGYVERVQGGLPPVGPPLAALAGRV